MEGKMIHQAQIFRNLRAKFLAISRTDGYKTGYYVLEKEFGEGKFDVKIFHGLLGELIFHQEKGNELDLTPTLDYGDHCDFRGEYNNSAARFDVTTSLEYKYLETYEPFQKDGKRYYIALIDTKKRKLDRIIDINFPFCKHCGGRLANVALIGDVDFTDAGTPTQTQRVVKVCSQDFTHNTDLERFDYYMPTIGDEREYIFDLYEGNEEVREKELNLIPMRHGIDNSLFFSKQINDKIHAVGHDIAITDLDGDIWLETQLYWKSDLVDQLLPDNFDDQI